MKSSHLVVIEGRYDNDDKLKVLDSCDAIIFGAPTYMGSPAAQFKSFMDASSDTYCKKAWRNKLAAGFTTGGSLNGEQQQTLLEKSFFTLACQHGMIWAGLDISKHIDDLGLNHFSGFQVLVWSPVMIRRLIAPIITLTAMILKPLSTLANASRA